MMVMTVHPHGSDYKQMNDKIQQTSVRQYVNCRMEDLLNLIKQDMAVWDYMNENYTCSIERIKVLQDIIYNIERQQKEELKNKIYLYGSLIGDQDLIARQVFLWLLAIVENESRPRKSKGSSVIEN